MSFISRFAKLIWDELYTVYIPDQLTLNPEYIRLFGTHVTQDKRMDKVLETNFTMVKIPIVQILTYFDQGVEIQIPVREDMIRMHKHIELYLGEWREYMRVSVHGNTDAKTHKDLIIALEKLSKQIYEKASSYEVLDNLFLNKRVKFGLLNPLQEHQEKSKTVTKPDYQGIGKLISKKTPSDSNGRFN